MCNVDSIVEIYVSREFYRKNQNETCILSQKSIINVDFIVEVNVDIHVKIPVQRGFRHVNPCKNQCLMWISSLKSMCNANFIAKINMKCGFDHGNQSITWISSRKSTCIYT